jgi:hypothetical protein
VAVKEFTPLEKLGLEAAARLYFSCRRQVARTIVAFLVKPDRPLGTAELAIFINWPDRHASFETMRTVMSETRTVMRRKGSTSEITNGGIEGYPSQYTMSNKDELIEQLKKTARMK